MFDLTIIVPTYRRPSLLKRCLDSIYKNFDHSIQVIVVDDCPDSSGSDIAKTYPANYYSKKGICRGLSRSRNIGLQLAESKFLAFLDDDDYLMDDGLSLLIQGTKLNKSFVFFDYYIANSNGRFLISNKETTASSLLIGNSIPVGSYVIEKSSVKYLFDEKMSSHEDWNFILDNTITANMVYANAAPVIIDKTENLTSSHQAMTRQRWALDYVAVFARNPAPELTQQRAKLLHESGLDVPEWLLSAKKHGSD